MRHAVVRSRIHLFDSPLNKGSVWSFEGGPFDLMSRRMVSGNNEVIANRIIKEIEVFPVVRDDAPVQKKWERSTTPGSTSGASRCVCVCLWIKLLCWSSECAGCGFLTHRKWFQLDWIDLRVKCYYTCVICVIEAEKQLQFCTLHFHISIMWSRVFSPWQFDESFLYFYCFPIKPKPFVRVYFLVCRNTSKTRGGRTR